MRAADLRELDIPSLRLAADIAARNQGDVALLAARFVAGADDCLPHTRVAAAHTEAQARDMVAIAGLVALVERHADQLLPIFEALERGEEVTIRQSRAAELVRPRSAVPVRSHWPVMRRPGTVMGPVAVAMAAEVR
ncbi:hypothetical protein [Methylobacterium nodulans]|uniref:Uncharacterized protein n=1 Tax=Methylobacterium nodulans (strain LMG 21967 / CNCM I-2342 / ORS 2060) TaxID=460265 RepID=B8INY2_METNO|nr:hypothetical protein [Methylobacterium nodulans]ACL58498.1 hypothetical protein Mnod_3589 [Methylobacterium nodulans ORS 2060]